QRKRRAGKIERPIGSIDKCERCGKDYVVNAGLQRFCEDCQLPHKLEHDYKRAMPKYEANKERYNPSRNERRRVSLRSCRICGKQFEPRSQQAMCSAECKRENN